MKGNNATPGIIPLAMQHVFQHVRQSRDHEFLLRMSYIGQAMQQPHQEKQFAPLETQAHAYIVRYVSLCFVQKSTTKT
jgi:hypothetical protein